MPFTLHFSLDATKVPFAADLTPQATNDTVQLVLTLTGDLLATDILEQIVFTAKISASDADNAATTVQKIVPSSGTITPLSPTVYQLVITFTAADLAQLVTKHLYDVKVYLQRGGFQYERVVLTGSITAGQGVTGLTIVECVASVVIGDPGPQLLVTGGQLFQSGTALTAPGAQLTAVGGQLYSAPAALVEPGSALAATGDNGIFSNYHPGDPIGGTNQPTFTRASTAVYYDSNGVVQTAASGVLRDGHYLGGVRHTLHEPQRTNALTYSQDYTNAVWTKSGASITAAATTAPDGTNTGQKITEDTTTAAHYIGVNIACTANTAQAHSLFAKAGTRSWIRILTVDTAGTQRNSWVNLSTGVTGTVDSGHTVHVVPLGSGWYRIEVQWTNGAGGATPALYFAMATGDAVLSYTGDGASSLYLWGAQHEKDQTTSTSYIATTSATVTRSADNLLIPIAPQGTHAQGVTAYIDHTSVGLESVLSSSTSVASAGQGASPALSFFVGAGALQIQTSDGLTNALAGGGAVPVWNHRHEWRGVLYPDDTVQSAAAVDGGAETVGTRGTQTATPQTNWGVLSFGLASVMPWAIRHVLLMRGAPLTMPTLRTIT